VESQPGETVFFHGHPSWLSMTPFLVRWMVVSLVAGIAAGIASIVADGREQTSWVIMAVLAVWLLTYARGQLRRRRVTYRITSRRLTVETGLVSRRLHEARLEAIQDVRVRQTLLQRALGTGTVHFDTAGELGYDLRFRGVDDPRRIVRAVDRALDGSRPEWYPPTPNAFDFQP
jgi:uncharacterized membrane protein YdbT with pleckstrin-like domain